MHRWYGITIIHQFVHTSCDLTLEDDKPFDKLPETLSIVSGKTDGISSMSI